MIPRGENKAGTGSAARRPTDDPAGKYVDYKGHIHKTLPRRDIGEVADPKDIWRWRMELAVHPIQRAR